MNTQKNAASIQRGPTLGRSSNEVTNKDAQAIRTQIGSAGFCHLPKLAMEWGVSVECIKRVAGKLATRRR